MTTLDTALYGMRMWECALPVARTMQEKQQQHRMMYSATLRRAQTFAASYQPNALWPQLTHIAPPNGALSSAVGRKYLTTLVSRDRLADHHDAVRHVGTAITLQLTLDALQDIMCQCVVQQSVAGHSDMTAAAVGVAHPRAKTTAFARRFEAAHETLQEALWDQSPESMLRSLEHCLQHPMSCVLAFDASSHQYYVLRVQSSTTLGIAMRILERGESELLDKLREYEQRVRTYNDGDLSDDTKLQDATKYAKMMRKVVSFLELLAIMQRSVLVVLQCIVHWNETRGDKQPLYDGHQVWHFLQWVRLRASGMYMPMKQEEWKLVDDNGNGVYPREFEQVEDALARAIAQYTGLVADDSIEFLLPQALEQADRWCVARKASVQCERLSSGGSRMKFERITRLPSLNNNILQHLTHTLKAPRFVQDFQRAIHPPLSCTDSRSRNDATTLLAGGPTQWELQWQALAHMYEDVLRQFVAELVVEHDGDRVTQMDQMETDDNEVAGDVEEEEEESESEEEEENTDEGKEEQPVSDRKDKKPKREKTRAALLEEQLETLETLMCAALVKSGLFDAKAMNSTRIEAFTSARDGNMDVFFMEGAARFGPLHVKAHDGADEDEQLQFLAQLLTPNNQTALVHELRQLIHDANTHLCTHAQSVGAEPCVQWRHVARGEERHDTTKQAALHPILREHVRAFDEQHQHPVYGSTQPMLVCDKYEQRHQYCVVRSAGDVCHSTLVPVFLNYFVALRNMLHALVHATMSHGKPLGAFDVDKKDWHTLSHLEAPCPGSMVDQWRACIGDSGDTLWSTDPALDVTKASLLYALRDGAFDAQSEWQKRMAEHHRELHVRQRDLVALLDQAVVRRAAYL